VVACSQSSDLYFLDLTANPPAILGKLSVGDGTGNTFYPASLAMSPDGQFVAVACAADFDPTTGQQRPTQINLIKVVSIADRSIAQTLDVSQLPDQGAGTLNAQAAAISSKGAIVIASPSTHPTGNPVAGELYALSYTNGAIDLPAAATNNGQLQVFPALVPNLAITPDGSTVIVPEGRQSLYTFSIDSSSSLTQTSPQGIPSGGDGVQSVAITADGKLAYALNLFPPANISVFQILPGSTLKDTGLRMNTSAVPDLFVQAGQLPVGNQMIAVTPDGKKVYAVNPYSGTPDPAFLGLYGTGELRVFASDKAAPIATLNPGKNPMAIAIQPH
jgi:DNA-binding beta-propeller fold protein YncE